MSQEIQYRVLFDFNRSELPDSAKLGLVRLINQASMSKVRIEGHCDSVGSKGYNRTLSLERAHAVARLLSQNGIDKKIISTCIGYGKEKPLNDNRSEQERQENRRVMVTLYPVNASIHTTSKRMELGVSKEATKMENPQTKRIPITDQPITKESLDVGNHLVFENLLFEPGRHILKEGSKEELLKVLDMLKEHPSLELEIQGHVCCTSIEADGYDWDTGKDNLSAARAYVVYAFLIQNGIEEYRLTHKGYGGSQKINSLENTEELKRVNRRVEFNILKR